MQSAALAYIVKIKVKIIDHVWTVESTERVTVNVERIWDALIWMYAFHTMT